MGAILEWVKQIACYLIFVTVLTGLLPDHRYEKYLRLFAGMVLVLLVIQPVTGTLGLDGQMARLFEEFQLKGEAGELEGLMSEAEQSRMERITERYREMAEEDVRAMAEAAGFCARSASVELDGDPESGGYGTVLAVSLTVAGGDSGEAAEAVRIQVAVEPVEIGGEDSRETGDSAKNAGQAEDTGRGEGLFAQERDRAAALREEIAGVYGLEEDHVEIRWED